jgi:hypothetical protein
MKHGVFQPALDVLYLGTEYLNRTTCVHYPTCDAYALQSRWSSNIKYPLLAMRATQPDRGVNPIVLFIIFAFQFIGPIM